MSCSHASIGWGTEMLFHVGQKVVRITSIDFHPDTSLYYEQLPVKDGIYTVRKVVMERYHDTLEEIPALLLVEIVNEPRPWANGGVHEAAFDASRFRPLVERKTDIAIFEKMLVPKRATEDA